MNVEIGGPITGGGGGVKRRSRFGPPPGFLTKTLYMVNDPNTNSIISWSQFGDSFIISDHIKFSAEILPNYFKHNNFSSFVYQLNNYGFRKIGVQHQWEYSSPHFQQGKPHLLSNMKRRSVQKPTPLRLSPETLMIKSMEESRHELKKQKKKQSEVVFHIMELKEKANNLEAESKKLVVQWAKACKLVVEREKVVVAEIQPPQENEEQASPAANEGSKSAEMVMEGDYFVELDNVKKRLFEDDDDDDDDEVCEVGEANDFQEWLIESTTL